MKLQRICLAPLLLLPLSSHAVNVYLQGGLHFGGDDLVTATFTNGDSETLKAGELLSLSAGVGFNVTEVLDARLLAGVKLDTIDAENGSVDFVRYPLEALLFYKASENILLGGGVTYHLNPSVSSDGVASGTNFDFDNALGFVVEVEYMFINGAYFGLNFTSIDYEATGVSVSGNSVGGIFGFRF